MIGPRVSAQIETQLATGEEQRRDEQAKCSRTVLGEGG